MGERSKKISGLSIIKNVINQQLGVSINKSFLSYYTTLNALQNLKPKTALENCPTVLSEEISEIQFNSKGNLLANLYWSNNAVTIWDWSKPKIQAFFSAGHYFITNQVNWIPADNENLIVTSGQHGDIRLMDLTTNISRLLENPYFEDEEISCQFCVNANSPYTILAGNRNGKVVVFDIREKIPTKYLHARHENLNFYQIYSIDINPKKYSEFCIGGYNDIRIYDYRNLSSPIQELSTIIERIKNIFQNDKEGILSVKYNYNGSEILAVHSKEPIYLFDTLRRYPIKTYVIKNQPKYLCSITIYNIHFVGTRSEFIVANSSASSNKMIRTLSNNIYIWDKDSEELVHDINLPERSWRFDTHPHKPILAMNSDFGGIQLWQ
jgi:hypothetical protein